MGCSRPPAAKCPFNMHSIQYFSNIYGQRRRKVWLLIRWQPISANGSIKPNAKLSLSLSLSQQMGKGKHLKRGHNSNSIQSSQLQLNYVFIPDTVLKTSPQSPTVLNSAELNDKTNCQRPTNSNFVLSSAVWSIFCWQWMTGEKFAHLMFTAIHPPPQFPQPHLPTAAAEDVIVLTVDDQNWRFTFYQPFRPVFCPFLSAILVVPIRVKRFCLCVCANCGGQRFVAAFWVIQFHKWSGGQNHRWTNFNSFVKANLSFWFRCIACW